MLQFEIDKTLKTLEPLDPLSRVYGEALYTLERLVDIQNRTRFNNQTATPIIVNTEPDEEIKKSEPKPRKTSKSSKAAAPAELDSALNTPESASTAEPETPTPIDAKTETTETTEKTKTPKTKTTKATKTAENTLTAETVRSLLMDAAQRGVLIEPLIGKYVPEGSPKRFSSVPASSYPDLCADLNAESHEGYSYAN